MASPLAAIHSLQFTAHFEVPGGRLIRTARPLPGSPAQAHHRPPGSTGAPCPAHTPREQNPAAAAGPQPPRGKGPRRGSRAASSVAHAAGPRRRSFAPLPSPAPRPAAAAPTAAALGGLSLAARRSPALAGRRSQDGRCASGSCGGLEAEAEPSHSRTSGLRFPAPGCSLPPAAAMRGPVHG